ncbi:MAG: efflux RND transporter periplasmic adaptor subunit, partial [Nannocystaceae bacterium]
MNEETDQQGRRSLEGAARGPDGVARPDVAPSSDEPRERSAARGPDGVASDEPRERSVARGPDGVASDEPRERSAARGPDGSAHADTTPSASGPVASPGVEPRRSGLERALARAGSSLGLVIVLAVGLLVGHLLGGLGRAGVEPSEVSHAQHSEPAAQLWTCSMYPQIRMAQPGRCPICGMELIPASDGASDSHDEHGGRVTLSPRAQALARVATEPVRRTLARTEVRLLGRVDHDESRLRTITPWTGGRIDRLLVRVTGTRIGKNQVVARLYSPEIYTATRELALAAAQAKKLAKSPHGGAQLGASTLAAARTRLRLLGVADREIEKIERTGKAPSDIDIRAPFSGTVLERHVEEGQYVAAGTPLYSVADLSEVWVQIDAYESDLPHL